MAMDGNTRIEMNAGGIDGLFSIASFDISLNVLENDIENVISSFQAVKSEIYNLSGGVGKLDDAVSALQARISNEEEKRDNLKNFEDMFSDFLDLATSIDDEVADLVNQNKEEFYQMNPHLRPPVPEPEHGGILDTIGKWVEALIDFGEAIWDLGVEIVDSIKEAWQENWDIILTTIVTVAIIIAGVAVIIATGGTAVAAAGLMFGCGLIVGGLGAEIAAYYSKVTTGTVNLEETLKGFWFGCASGMVIGLGIHVGTLAKVKTIGKWAKLGRNVLKDGLVALGKNFADQTIMENIKNGREVGSFEQFDWGDMISDIGFSMVMGEVLRFFDGNGIVQFKGFKTTNFIKEEAGKLYGKIGDTLYNTIFGKVAWPIDKGHALETLSALPMNFVKGFRDSLIKTPVKEVWEHFIFGNDIEFKSVGDALKNACRDGLIKMLMGFYPNSSTVTNIRTDLDPELLPVPVNMNLLPMPVT